MNYSYLLDLSAIYFDSLLNTHWWADICDVYVCTKGTLVSFHHKFDFRTHYLWVVPNIGYSVEEKSMYSEIPIVNSHFVSLFFTLWFFCFVKLLMSLRISKIARMFIPSWTQPFGLIRYVFFRSAMQTVFLCGQFHDAIHSVGRGHTRRHQLFLYDPN